MIFWPAILIVILTAALLAWQPPELASYRVLFALAFVVAALVLILTYLYRVRAYVRCHDHALIVQLPFYRLTIPYTLIEKTHPSDLFRLFPPSEQRAVQNNFLEPLFGQTVLVVEIFDLPAPRNQLGLWLSKYMLSPDHTGIVLPVRDWIALDTEIEEHRTRSQYFTERLH
jgi:hypothetical protein